MGTGAGRRRGRGRSRPLMQLVGRDRDVDVVQRLLSAHRLVTVVGAGGIGKTAVCAHVAAVERDGGGAVLWVDLAALPRDDEVMSSIASAAALDDPAVAAGADDDRVTRWLDVHGAALIVLDNCEHVVATVVAAVEYLLERAPGLRVLATSRVPLDIPGEVTWRLGPLTLPPAGVAFGADDLERFGATALFAERALGVRPTLDVDDADAADIAALCRALDGNPLAVLIAAAQVRSLPIAELVASIRRSNRLLRSAGEDDRFDVDDSIRWSTELLDDAGRELLVALAVIPGEFDLDLACAVGAERPGSGMSVDDLLASVSRLVDHGLVEFDGARYRLTFVVRHFVAALPDSTDALARAGERHARAVIGWAVDQTRWGNVVRPTVIDERAADVHTAVGWAIDHDGELACEAFAAFGVMLHGPMHARYCAWLVERADRGPMWARAIGWLAILAPPAAHAMIAGVFPDAVVTAERTGDDHAQRLLACTPTYMALIACDLQPARELVGAAIAADDGWIVVATATTAALVGALMGRFGDVERFADSTRWACRQGGLDIGSTAIPIAQAVVLHERGAPADAELMLRTVVDHGQVGVTRLQARTRVAIDRADTDGLHAVLDEIGRENALRQQDVGAMARAGLSMCSGDWAAAVAVVEPVIGRGAAWDVDLTAQLAAAQLNAGAQDAARRSLDDLASRVGRLTEPAPLFASRLSVLLARAALDDGDLDAAQRWVAEALVVAREHQLRLVQIDAVDVCADVASCRGNARTGQRLRHAADAARRSTGYRSRLMAGPTRESAAVGTADERALGLDDAVALALRTRGARRRPAFGISSLTPTERSVARLVSAGRTNAEIAAELLMSVATVKTHLTHMFAKLDVGNRTQLARAVTDAEL